MPGSSKWSLTLKRSHQRSAHTSTLPIYATYRTHLILLELITQRVVVEYRSLSFSLCSFHHSCFGVPLGPKFSPQHPFINILSLHSSLNVSDQVSHPYKTS
jgi:hypothetical protein